MKKRIKRHSVIKIVIIGAGILVLLSIALVLRLRNGVVIKPVAAAAPKDVIYFAQKDDDWKDDKLGNSVYRMENSGCLTTCIAAVMQMEQLDSKNPGEVNQLFSKKGVYDRQGNIQWNELERSVGITAVREQVMEESEIQALLQQEIFPIVRVRVAGLGSFHYVVLVGSDENTFLCMDPLNDADETIPLSAYGNRIYAIRYLK